MINAKKSTPSKKHVKELDKYMKEVIKYPLIKKEEEYRLGEIIQSETSTEKEKKVAKDKLVVANLRICVKEAYKYIGYIERSSGRFNLLDLIQAGNEGLIRATELYNPTVKCRFITYAVWWINSKIRKFIIENYYAIKFGTVDAERIVFFKGLSTFKEINDTRDSTLKEKLRNVAANRLGLSQKDIRKLESRTTYREISVNTTKLENSTTDYIENIPSGVNEENIIENKDFVNKLKDIVEEAMVELSEREKEILQKRYMNEELVTFQSIGNELGVSRQRISQIEQSGIAKIRKYIKENTQISLET